MCSYIFRHIYTHVQIHVSLHVCGSQRTTSQVSFLRGPSTSPLFLRWAFPTALCHIGHTGQVASLKVCPSLPPQFWYYKYTTTLDPFLNPGDQAQVLVLAEQAFYRRAIAPALSAAHLHSRYCVDVRRTMSKYGYGILRHSVPQCCVILS